VTWRLRAHDTVLPAGRVLGLVLTASDTEFTLPTTTGATIDVDLGRSRLNLPVSLRPGDTALPAVAVAPRVTATAPEATRARPAADRWPTFR
jgi:X-Pro dipeptidyl-peptidase